MKGLRKRPNGAWEGRFYDKSRNPKSKSIYFSTDFTKVEIEDMWMQMRKAYKLGEYDPWTQVTTIGEPDIFRLEGAIKQFEEIAKGRYAKSTQQNYATALSQLKKKIGANRHINDITISELELFVNSFYRGATRNIKASAINGLFDMLYRDGHLEKKIEVKATGGAGERQKDYLTLQQFDRMERYYRLSPERWAKGDMYPDIWWCGFLLGMRIDEINHFKPKWVSENLKTITYGDEDYQPKKRDEGTLDTIPILDEAKPRLARILEGKKPDELVFGGFIPSTNYNKFKDCAHAIFPDKYLTPHSLRKSYAMYLIHVKELHPKNVQEMMRHEKFETTMTYYTSKDLEQLEEALNGKGKKLEDGIWVYNGYHAQNKGSDFDQNSGQKSHLRLIK